jgi:hypothetical protein
MSAKQLQVAQSSKMCQVAPSTKLCQAAPSAEWCQIAPCTKQCRLQAADALCCSPSNAVREFQETSHCGLSKTLSTKDNAKFTATPVPGLLLVKGLSFLVKVLASSMMRRQPHLLVTSLSSAPCFLCHPHLLMPPSWCSIGDVQVLTLW